MDSANKNLCMGCMEELRTEGICPYCGFDNNTKHDSNYIAPGTQLDARYIIGSLQQKNGEGAVYIGYDNQADKPVWVKEYFPGNIATRDPETMEVAPMVGCGAQYKALLSDFIELAGEVRRLGTSEPVLPIENLIGENNTIYVIYKHIEALSLEEYLVARGGKLSEAEAKTLLIPLLNGVDNFHISGLIHRGLSPYTILVDEHSKLYIDGFSLGATRTGGSELKSELFNGYSAPEQYLSTGWQGTWTDVYSLGAIFYRTTTGVVPPKSTRSGASGNMLTLKDTNPEIRKQLSSAVSNAMQTVVKNRTQTVAAFLSEIIAEDGVPKTEIFDVNRMQLTMNEENTANKEDTVLPKTIRVILEDFPEYDQPKNTGFKPNFKQEELASTISTPVKDMYEYREEKDFEFNDHKDNQLPNRYEEEVATKKAPKGLILGLIIAGILVGIAVAVFLSIKLGLVNNNKKPTVNTDRPELVEPATTDDTQTGEATEEKAPIVIEREDVIAPDLTGKKISAVEFNKEYTEFFVFRIKEEYSEEHEKGIIIEQIPKPGKEMPVKGGTIVLTVSKGKLEMTMPDLAGKELEEALQELKKLTEEMEIIYEDVKIETVSKYSSAVKEGSVISSLPEGGKVFDPLKEKIEIYVALKPPVTTTEKKPEPKPVPKKEPERPLKNPDGSDAGPNG